MRGSVIVGQGAPSQVLTADLVKQVFGLACRVIEDPESHTPLVIPRMSRPHPIEDPSEDRGAGDDQA